MKLSAEEFVKVWQNSDSIRDVTKASGTKLSACYGRAIRYRKLGIPLKDFERRPSNIINVDTLIKLAKQNAPKS